MGLRQIGDDLRPGLNAGTEFVERQILVVGVRNQDGARAEEHVARST